MRQEPLPVLPRQLRVLGQLPLDHQLLDVVDGVHVGHAVLDHAAHLLQPFVWPHGADRVALHEDVAAREELERFQRAPVRSQDALPPLHEAVPVAHQVPDLDDVGGAGGAVAVVVEDADGLRGGDAAAEQLDAVARGEDGRRVVGLERGADRHAPRDEVERAGDVVPREGAGDERPGGEEVLLAVLGEDDAEGGLLGEGPGRVVLRGEGVNLWLGECVSDWSGGVGLMEEGMERWVYLPLVDGVVVPFFLLVVFARHFGLLAYIEQQVRS